jgi:predicted Fe-Mo cluster-binding NifX family protein
LVELGVGTLVCGAISRPLHDMVASQGIRVVPFVTGDLDKVVQAWLNGELARDAFCMPGCCRRRHRFQRMRGRRHKE